MKKYAFLLLISTFLLNSCTEYQKILKSTDPDLKYNKAVEYFNKGDYMRASTLFDDISVYYKGTDRSEAILMYLAKSYMGQKDYYSASEYYKTYARTYPKGKYIEQAKFMIGYCYYLNSPDPRLDQTATYNAINALQEFIDYYPENKKVPEASKLIEELNNKLAYKELLNAQLYYNLGNYQGNNYLAAVITAQNALTKYPSSKYREDLSFLILKSKYQEAVQSIYSKRTERYRRAIDEYYNYINEYPNGKYKKQADKILKACEKIVKD